MPRTARYAPSWFVYHVLNRAVARLPLFANDVDYEAFLRVQTERSPIRVDRASARTAAGRRSERIAAQRRPGAPFGSDVPVRQTADTWGLESTRRSRGRPKKDGVKRCASPFRFPI